MLLKVRGDYDLETSVRWAALEDAATKTWNDDEDATEQGAYGIALVLLPQLTQMSVIFR